jgi:hypothetical protein
MVMTESQKKINLTTVNDEGYDNEREGTLTPQLYHVRMSSSIKPKLDKIVDTC